MTAASVALLLGLVSLRNEGAASRAPGFCAITRIGFHLGFGACAQFFFDQRLDVFFCAFTHFVFAHDACHSLGLCAFFGLSPGLTFGFSLGLCFGDGGFGHLRPDLGVFTGLAALRAFAAAGFAGQTLSVCARALGDFKLAFGFFACFALGYSACCDLGGGLDLRFHALLAFNFNGGVDCRARLGFGFELDLADCFTAQFAFLGHLGLGFLAGAALDGDLGFHLLAGETFVLGAAFGFLTRLASLLLQGS
jgi:hypothetical protein